MAPDTLEILIQETSKAYKGVSNEKKSFDHYKGTFGLMTLLETVVDCYPYADFKLIEDMKDHFLHIDVITPSNAH
ncbi:hypothetical protein DFQ28_010716 [Apophysomyces sp. BC1034]|nr:hypothetical protein DFQ28_010716 [Apophysomyces sp. BC1034]